MSESLRRRAIPGLALAGILALALGLRLWGIGFGLPYPYHVDEPTYVSAALNLGAGIRGEQLNPTGFINLLCGEYAAYFIAGRLTGVFASTADFARAYRADPSVFLLLGRLTSALLGALTALVVFLFGWASGRRRVGWLAALFMAVIFLHVRDSYFGVPDVTTAFLVGLSVVLCVLAVDRPRRAYFYLAALAGGYALATKWSIWPLLVPLVLTAIVRRRRGWSSIPEAAIAVLCLAGGVAVGAFQILYRPAAYLDYALREQQAGSAGGYNEWRVDTVAGWVFYLETLAYSLGIVLAALALVGVLRRLVHAVRRPGAADWVILSFPVVYFLVMGASRHYFVRYALPLAPFAVLFAAEAVAASASWLEARRVRGVGYVNGGLALLAVLATVQPVARDVAFDRLMTRVDTRTIAKEWIEANIPAGTKIAVDWRAHGPPLSTPELAWPASTRVYDVTTVGETGLSEHPLQWYVDNGFRYLITTSFIYDLPLVDPGWDAKRRQFYASLDQNLELVQEFRPYSGDTAPDFVFDEIYGPIVSLWQRDRPGPTLKIYRLQ